MDYVELGNTGITVSRLCFGSLTIGPLQANLPIEEGAGVIAEALKLGVNFIDTAQYYRTYSYIKRAIDITGIRPVIASKCYAYTREGAIDSLEKALFETGLDYIDIFMLHEQESEYTLDGHRDAINYFLEAKRRGLIKAFGVSTHYIRAVHALTKMPEVDVVHAILNKSGIGIADGSTIQMLDAINKCSASGKGIYAMKALGGGHLLNEFSESIKFVMNIPSIDSIAVGMKSKFEVKLNVDLFEGKLVSDDVIRQIVQNKRLHIEDWCSGCGECVKRCSSNALSVVNGKVNVDDARCILCGYCGGVCPEFALKII